MKTGIITLIVTFLIAFALIGFPGALIVTGVVLVLLPPRFDPAIQIKEKQTLEDMAKKLDKENES